MEFQEVSWPPQGISEVLWVQFGKYFATNFIVCTNINIENLNIFYGFQLEVERSNQSRK